MIKTQTETFRGYGKETELSVQTAVECRFGQEVATVLLAHASASLTGADAGDGEVRYYGKAHFILVYEDAERRVCRAERGVEFTAVGKDGRITPALTARALVAVENVSVRREGASVYVTALLGADIALYGEQTFDYLSGGDLICRREPVKVYCAHLCGGACEAEDEFETPFLGDILLHAETAQITSAACGAGTLGVEGEVNVCLLALRGEQTLVSFERLVPFRVDIPCEEATAGCEAEARVSVLSAAIRAEADEERGKCRILAEVTLGVEGCVYEEAQADAVTDAFSRTHEVTLRRCSVESTGAGEYAFFAEKIAGRAALSSPVDFSDVLQAVTLQRAEASLVEGGGELRAEGVAAATLLVLGADGTHRGIEMSLPFSLPVPAGGACVSVLACGMSARQKQAGEIEAEATLKFVVGRQRHCAASLVTAAEEGAPLELCDSAISLYIPRAGDGLWELSKRLKKSPEEVAKNNPDLEFPVREGQRVILYRKKSLPQ